MSKGHVHAELMAQYAQDALETASPWQRWQSRGKEAGHDNMPWRDMRGHPKWEDHRDYRRKPTQVQVAGEVFDDVVLDLKKAPDQVFVVLSKDKLVTSHRQSAYSSYAHGLVHTTYEGALRHLEALKPKVL